MSGSYKNSPGERMAMISQMALERLDLTSPYGEPNPIGVLIAAKESFDRDELARNFDIIDFHLRCWDMLLAVQNMCLEEASSDYPAVRFGNEQGSAVFMAELLRDLASCQRHHERMWPRAITILSEMIEARGSICCHAAQERMVLTEMVFSDSDCDTPPSSSSETVKADPPTPVPNAPDADVTALDVSKFITPAGGEFNAHGNVSGSGADQP
jgi:hypothetical protein